MRFSLTLMRLAERRSRTWEATPAWCSLLIEAVGPGRGDVTSFNRSSAGVTDVYDHKRGLELRLREFGCSDVFAATYFSSAEALQAVPNMGSEGDAV